MFDIVIVIYLIKQLASTAEKFLSLIKTEDSKYLAYYIRNKQLFTFNQTIKQVNEAINFYRLLKIYYCLLEGVQFVQIMKKD